MRVNTSEMKDDSVVLKNPVNSGVPCATLGQSGPVFQNCTINISVLPESY